MEWISVEEELPKSGFSCLISDGKIVTESFYSHDGHFHKYIGEDGRPHVVIEKVIEWQPMPKPSKKNI